MFTSIAVQWSVELFFLYFFELASTEADKHKGWSRYGHFPLSKQATKCFQLTRSIEIDWLKPGGRKKSCGNDLVVQWVEMFQAN